MTLNLLKKNNSAALKEFSTVIKQYPSSAKRPDAEYKIASIQMNTGHVADAKQGVAARAPADPHQIGRDRESSASGHWERNGLQHDGQAHTQQYRQAGQELRPTLRSAANILYHRTSSRLPGLPKAPAMRE